MPKYKFLKDGEKLNKNNFGDVVQNLYLNATTNVIPTGNELDDAFKKIEKLNIYDRFQYFIMNSKKYIKYNKALDIMKSCGMSEATYKERAVSSYLSILNDYGIASNGLNELKNFLRNKDEIKDLTVVELSLLVKNHLKQEDKAKVKVSPLDFLGINYIIEHFDKYMSYLYEDMSDAEMEEFGNMVNDIKVSFEFDINDDLTNPLYDKETQEIINELKTTRKLDGIELTEEEIKEYEDSLNYVNKIYGEPKMDLVSMQYEKNGVEKAISHDHQKNVDDRIKNLGFDPKPFNHVSNRNDPVGYDVLHYKKFSSYFHNEKDAEMKFSDETKNAIIEIVNKMHEYNFDIFGMSGEQGQKVYGLNPIYNSYIKYKNAITSNSLEERKKAAIYAKEISIKSKQVDEIFSLIEKYMPVDKDNLAFPGNVDVMRTNNLPAKYRYDYVRMSHFAALNSLANLVNDKNWDIKDFINEPIKYMKELYKDDYLAKINPTKVNKDIKGSDIIFNLGKNKLGGYPDIMLLGGPRILEGLVCMDKNKENRLNNEAINQVFQRTIANPINYLYSTRDNLAKNDKLDRLIINPKLDFLNLEVKYYDANNINMIDLDGLEFDEVKYINDTNESLSDLKNRIDDSILSFMTKEAEHVLKFKDQDAMFLHTNDYVNLVQKALAKILVCKRCEKDDPDYQALEGLIRNKREYVNNLINRIPNDNRLEKYNGIHDIAINKIQLGQRTFDVMQLDDINSYNNILATYDNEVTTFKTYYKNSNERFINEETILNTGIKNLYNEYLNKERSYQTEVRKTYGANYKGDIDNGSNKKLADSYTKKLEALRKLERAKGNYLRRIEKMASERKIPLSYYIDRKAEIEANSYNSIAPIFRSEKPLSLQEFDNLYIKNKYKDITITDEVKNALFEQYKVNIAIKENEFYSKRFLESKKMISKNNRNIDVDVKILEVKHKKMNEAKLEAKFLGISDNVINDEKIGDIDSKFDDVMYLFKKTLSPSSFKTNLDKMLLDYLKDYKAKENNLEELKNLYKLEDYINVAQKACLKYILTYNIDENNKYYKDLKSFVVDGNGYINRIIKEENKAIDDRNRKIVDNLAKQIEENPNGNKKIELNNLNLEKSITFTSKDFNVSDTSINKYGNKFNEFNDYYKECLPTKNIPENLKRYELSKHNEIVQEERHLNFLLNKKKKEVKIIEPDKKPLTKYDTRKKIVDKLLYDAIVKENNDINNNNIIDENIIDTTTKNNNFINNNIIQKNNNNILDDSESSSSDDSISEDSLFRKNQIKNKNEIVSLEAYLEQIGQLNNYKNENVIDEDKYASLDMQIAISKARILRLKNDLKERLYYYYNEGNIPAEYVIERFKRIDNNDYTLPTMFKLDSIKSMDRYISEKYPNQTFTKREKTDLYNNYKSQFIESKRQFILRNFITRNNLTENTTYRLKEYDDYLKSRPDALLIDNNKMMLKAEEIYGNKIKKELEESFIAKVNRYEQQNNIAINNKIDNNIIIENENINKDNKINIIDDSIISIKDDFNLNIKKDIDENIIDEDDLELNTNDVIALRKQDDEIDEELIHVYDNIIEDENLKAKDVREYEDKRVDPIEAWVKSLKGVMKDTLGKNKYEEEEIDKFYNFEKSDSFDDWVELRADDLKRLFNNKLSNVFEESVNRLKFYERKQFEKQYYKYANGTLTSKFFNDLFGHHKFLPQIENPKVEENLKIIDKKVNLNVDEPDLKLDDFKAQLINDLNDNKAIVGSVKDEIDEASDDLSLEDEKMM